MFENVSGCLSLVEKNATPKMTKELGPFYHDKQKIKVDTRKGETCIALQVYSEQKFSKFNFIIEDDY
ncbi:hypothetical protein DERP_001550 [Dermatophagoides pteronyssinus]|uniref:Uncharacterized protein n=1 Tax=Dermatophagoides pteronyssinus TaxID=6956 RepID=A0ABQ8JAU8_DERPT|nr:hypothetical protein DERP_001550 [Dermatophagoides pteronyssinus]